MFQEKSRIFRVGQWGSLSKYSSFKARVGPPPRPVRVKMLQAGCPGGQEVLDLVVVVSVVV